MRLWRKAAAAAGVSAGASSCWAGGWWAAVATPAGLVSKRSNLYLHPVAAVLALVGNIAVAAQ